MRSIRCCAKLRIPIRRRLKTKTNRTEIFRWGKRIIVVFGALIRGRTPQYAVLAQAAAQGLTQVAVARRIPVTFGLVVAETPAQARARAGLPAPRRGKRGAARQAGGAITNRGEEAALAALAVLGLFERFDPHPR